MKASGEAVNTAALASSAVSNASLASPSASKDVTSDCNDSTEAKRSETTSTSEFNIEAL